MNRASKRTVAAGAAALVVGAIWTCSSGSDSPTAPAPPTEATVTVTVNDDFFDPQSVTINPGDTVRWVFEGSDPHHTVTEREEAWDTGFIFTSEGDTYERTFETSGETHEYFCRTHRDCCDMTGSVRVGQDAPDPSPGY